MKKLIYSALIVLIASFGFSQNNETINNGRVIGSFDLGSKEVTTIMDETTDCVRKSSPHSKGLFIPNETVELVLKENRQMAEVRKPALPEQVWANKKCGDNVGSENPYDFVGVLHNQTLDYIGTDPRFSNQIDFATTYTIAKEYIQGLNNETVPFFDDQSSLDYFTSYKDNYEGFTNQLLSEGIITGKVKKEADRIFTLIEKTGNTNALIQSLKKTENGIISSSRYSEGERAMLLITCSVAKHSTQFWVEATGNELSSWHSVAVGDITDEEDIIELKINWGKILADTGGALLGAGLGVGSGLLGGPIVGAAVGGAAVTALASGFSGAVN